MPSIEVKVDLSGTHIDRTIAEFRPNLGKAVEVATRIVWADATDRGNWGRLDFVRGKSVSAAARLSPANPPPGPLRIITGTLLRSIQTDTQQTQPGEFQGTVGSPLIYGLVHERGNYKTPARPFLGPALERKREQVVELIRKAAPGG